MQTLEMRRMSEGQETDTSIRMGKSLGVYKSGRKLRRNGRRRPPKE